MKESDPNVVWLGNGMERLGVLDECLQHGRFHLVRNLTFNKVGKHLVLKERDTSKVAMVINAWTCSCCTAKVKFSNCEKVRTSEVADGALHSWSKPDFNIQIMKGAILVGINSTNMLVSLYGQLRIKI